MDAIGDQSGMKFRYMANEAEEDTVIVHAENMAEAVRVFHSVRGREPTSIRQMHEEE